MSPRGIKYVPHYKQGPQGNMVADFKSDYELLHGKATGNEILGTPGLRDLRDNSDPGTVGRTWLAEREATRKADKARNNGK